MKKISLHFSNFTSVQESGPAALTTLFGNMDRPIMEDMVLVINEMLQNGDIWFIHDKLHETQQGVDLVMILDSSDALDSFIKDAIPFLETAGLDYYDVEDISFEEFATFASTNDETTFNPFEVFSINP